LQNNLLIRFLGERGFFFVFLFWFVLSAVSRSKRLVFFWLFRFAFGQFKRQALCPCGMSAKPYAKTDDPQLRQPAAATSPGGRGLTALAKRKTP